MKKLFFLSACSLMIFIACKQPETGMTAAAMLTYDSDSAKQEIEASNAKFGPALASGDSAAISALYTTDAEIYMPNAPKMDVKAMSSAIKTMPAMGLTKMELKVANVIGGPQVFSEVGTYEMTGGTKTLDKGKYIVLWKKEDGKLKMYRDIWNSDMAPMPMPEKK